MQIANRAILAVECMAWLRSCSRLRPGKSIWLADRIQRSVSYTEALLARLREAGFIEAKKGAGGGYYLVRPADRISVAEILEVFDTPQLEFPPPRGGTAAAEDTPAPAVDALCRGLRAYARQFLAGVSLADVGDGPAAR